jgi:diacylglycerol kinase (ATP)
MPNSCNRIRAVFRSPQTLIAETDTMAKPGNTGITRLLNATRYSAQGITSAWKSEEAFRQELTLMLLMIPAAFWLGKNAVEYALLIGSCLLVVIVELLNSAVESVVDRISNELHPLSGQAKDMGSAAVLFSLLIVISTWGLIALERFG